MYVWIDGSLPGRDTQWPTKALEIMSTRKSASGGSHPLVVIVTLAPQYEEARKYLLSIREAHQELWIIPGIRMDTAPGKPQPVMDDVFKAMNMNSGLYKIAGEFGEICISASEAFANTLRRPHTEPISYRYMLQSLENWENYSWPNGAPPEIWWTEPFITERGGRTEETERMVGLLCGAECNPYKGFRFAPTRYYARGEINMTAEDKEGFNLMRKRVGNNRVHPVVFVSSGGNYPSIYSPNPARAVRWAKERGPWEPPSILRIEPGDLSAIEELMTCANAK